LTTTSGSLRICTARCREVESLVSTQAVAAEPLRGCRPMARSRSCAAAQITKRDGPRRHVACAQGTGSTCLPAKVVRRSFHRQARCVVVGPTATAPARTWTALPNKIGHVRSTPRSVLGTLSDGGKLAICRCAELFHGPVCKRIRFERHGIHTWDLRLPTTIFRCRQPTAHGWLLR
jgi:hypothetical protein